MASKSESSNITFQKEIKSIKQPEKNIGVLPNATSKVASSVNTEKCALICSFLKQKPSEALSLSLTLSIYLHAHVGHLFYQLLPNSMIFMFPP